MPATEEAIAELGKLLDEIVGADPADLRRSDLGPLSLEEIVDALDEAVGGRRSFGNLHPLHTARSLPGSYRPLLDVINRCLTFHIDRRFQLCSGIGIRQRPSHRKRLRRRIGDVIRRSRPPFPLNPQSVHESPTHLKPATQLGAVAGIDRAERCLLCAG